MFYTQSCELTEAKGYLVVPHILQKYTCLRFTENGNITMLQLEKYDVRLMIVIY